MAFEFNIGDKVRYREDGHTTVMRGVEGEISELYNQSCALAITKMNSSKLWKVGEPIYPDLENLELIVEGTLPAQATANTITNFSIGGTDLVEAAELAQLADLRELITAEAVEHPAHYGGDTPYEVIKVAEAWGIDKDAYLFNVIKYVGRAGKKSKATLLEDLKKARFYLDRRIKRLEEASANNS